MCIYAYMYYSACVHESAQLEYKGCVVEVAILHSPPAGNEHGTMYGYQCDHLLRM